MQNKHARAPLVWPASPIAGSDVLLEGEEAVGTDFRSGASTDEDGVPRTPPDAHFLEPNIKDSISAADLSSPSSRSSSRSRPASMVHDIALSDAPLLPFSHRALSRSPSPQPSPQLFNCQGDRYRLLPAGFEHIPWISDEEDSDIEGRLSRSLSPPLQDFLSLPPLSPDIEDATSDAVKPEGNARTLSPVPVESTLPPSPPRTPSPRRRFTALPPPEEQEHPWATSPERSPGSPDGRRLSPSPRRRSSTRSGLPTLRNQLSPPQSPSELLPSSPLHQSSRNDRLSSAKPTRPSLAVAISAERRASKPASQSYPSPSPSPTQPSSVGLSTPDDAYARQTVTDSSERGQSCPAKRGSDPELSRTDRRGKNSIVPNTAAEEKVSSKPSSLCGLQLSFPSVDEHEQAEINTPASTEADLADDPHSLDYFERNSHSLSLLRLRHALSVASVYATLAHSTATSSYAAGSPSIPWTSSLDSPQRKGRSGRPQSLPDLPANVSTRTTCARGAATMALGSAGVGSLISQQYRLYAMGRAKAQRTGGVGYWEGGIQAWELLLMD